MWNVTDSKSQTGPTLDPNALLLQGLDRAIATKP